MKKKGLIILASVVGGLVLAATLVLGYFGFMPGVRSLFGSDKPRDLGVAYSEKAWKSAHDKTKVKLIALPSSNPAENSITSEGSHPTVAEFTNEELTAIVHNWPWRYYPVSDCQVRVNQDGSFEVSGMLLVDRARGYAAATGLSPELADQAVGKLGIAGDQPFYLKAMGSAENDRVDITVISAEVGRFPVPSGWLSDYKSEIASFVENRMSIVQGFSVKSVNFENGKMRFEGTLPDSISSVR